MSKIHIKKMSKRMRSLGSMIDKDKLYGLQEAVSCVKKAATAKFDETVEIHFRLNIDTRQSDQNIRGMADLPHGSGKKVRVVVFAKGDKLQEAKAAGADIAGDDDLIEEIRTSGNINFDRCIATPDMMGSLGKIAKVLGPKGLMPNPKLGTVTMDVASAVKSAKAGQVEYRADKTGIVHVPVGKASFDDQKLFENIKYISSTISRARPSGVKGNFMLTVYLTSTMGPSIRLNLVDLLS